MAHWYLDPDLSPEDPDANIAFPPYLYGTTLQSGYNYYGTAIAESPHLFEEGHFWSEQSLIENMPGMANENKDIQYLLDLGFSLANNDDSATGPNHLLTYVAGIMTPDRFLSQFEQNYTIVSFDYKLYIGNRVAHDSLNPAIRLALYRTSGDTKWNQDSMDGTKPIGAKLIDISDDSDDYTENHWDLIDQNTNGTDGTSKAITVPSDFSHILFGINRTRKDSSSRAADISGEAAVKIEFSR